MPVNNPTDRRSLSPCRSFSEGDLAGVALPASVQHGAAQASAQAGSEFPRPNMRRQRSLPELQLRQALNERQASRVAQPEGAARVSVLSQAREEFDAHTTADRLRSRESLTAQAVDRVPEAYFDAVESFSDQDASSVPDAEISEFLADVFSHPTAYPSALSSSPAYSEMGLSRDELLAHWNSWASSGPPDEKRAEAVRRLLKCLDGVDEDDQENLDLGGLSLRCLPEHLPPLITDLSLAKNRLTAIPENLPPGLRFLDVSANQLTTVPGNLPEGLWILDVSENRIDVLPETLPAGLEELKASRNRLTRLPESLPQSLVSLEVIWNRLTHLPDALPNSLEMLAAYDNQLTQLPDSLPDSLLELWVYRNQLTYLPDSLPNSLLKLDVSENRLSHLPDSLPDSLQEICAFGNVLTHLPDSLPNALRKLDVNNNQLTHLPDSLPSALRKLDIHDNQLTDLPDALPNSLQVLKVSGNQLNRLPYVLPSSLRELEINSNRFTRFPDTLPDSLQKLWIAGNRLTHLPDALPNSLLVLDVNTNQLTRLPDSLPNLLRELYVAENRLTHLPDALPNSLFVLDVNTNQLTRLPDSLPNFLRELCVTRNRLTHLPENITTQLSHNCTVELEGNPLPLRVIQSLGAAMNAPGYQGPRFTFSMGDGRPAGVVVRPLAEAAAAWFAGNDQDAARQTWTAFQNEDGHDAFSGFLDYLGRTVNAVSLPFRQATAEWLTHLAAHPQLRQDSFAISVGATASCEDRVSLIFNQMKIARVQADVRGGHYNQRLPELINVARGMFRLEKLFTIAQEKVRSLRFVDEIEVYLGYQVKLRSRLELPIDTEDMRWFEVSEVTAEDLNIAETAVREAETIGFADYLSVDWSPWQDVLKQLELGLYEAAHQQLHETTETQFEDRLKARLQKDGLENDSDARRTVGPLVMAEIKREVMGELTQTFLKSRNLFHLLE